MDALVPWVVPYFSRNLCRQIQAILAGTRIFALITKRRVKKASCSVIKHQDVLIKSDRWRMLTNRRQAVGRKRNRKSPQRRKLMPCFRRVSENPFNCACFIIEAYQEVFPSRNDYGGIPAIVGNAVVMEPVTWRLINEVAGIISPSDHGCADDVSQIPLLQNPSCSVYFNVHRVIVRCGICIQDNSDFATVDVMV